MELDGRSQLHLMGIEGTSKFAKSPDKDPALPHVALAVPDIRETKTELDRLGVSYWTTRGVTGPEQEQVFVKDPAGNMIELHQAGTCRCNKSSMRSGGAMA
jgi:catechol 2,3-dioxygenase-like lactoylglutathione lyase family enzyme